MSPGQVYQPREDTYLLARAALAEVAAGELVLEMGTGSGYIARRLMESGARVVATDINPFAVKAAKSEGLEVIRTDLFHGLCGPFDLIVFNPPYLPTRPEERIDDWLEYALDGGPDGRKVIEIFAKQAAKVLPPAGRILLLISSLTGPAEVKKIFRRLGFRVEVVRKERVCDEDLLVLRCTWDSGSQ
ncbi:MAG TPA: HemK2/MTQ2 family protein methyltransferase [Methanoregulaceae archaeon]|nr:HemK2/MTQ2 family protein methyltransferase [Methanoregulaceae archaeon]